MKLTLQGNPINQILGCRHLRESLGRNTEYTIFVME